MKVYNIVLTGGPASGKTTILEEIKKKFDSDDTKVITVPEAATELFGWNIPVLSGEKALVYQDNIYKKQKSNQEIANSLAKLQDCKTVLIIYDRALLDNKAYLDAADFNRLLRHYKDSELVNLDFYDLVINLQSTANLDNQYKKESNPARVEDKETAKALGKKTLESWIMHRNLYNVKATDTIEAKTKSVINIIDNYVNKNLVKKKRYLIDYKEGQKLVRTIPAKSINEADYFFCDSDYYLCSISHRNNYNDDSFVGKIYTSKSDYEYVESDIPVFGEFLDLFLEGKIFKSFVDKKIYRFIYDDEVFELVFTDNLCFLRILTNKNIKYVKLPDNINLQKEINCEEYYDMIFNEDLGRKLL
jgi:predicted ATPase